MGLLFECDLISDLGFPESVILQSSKVGITEVFVDYTPAVEAFVETFTDSAYSLVPVDTGYLRSTISVQATSNTSVMAEATAEYAEYVEYGTYKMSAQPYFAPAVAVASAVMIGVAKAVLSSAEQEAIVLRQQRELEYDKKQRKKDKNRGGVGGAPGGKGIMGNIMLAGFLFLLFPIILPIYAVGATLADAIGWGGSWASGSSAQGDMSSAMDGMGGGGSIPPIRIT